MFGMVMVTLMIPLEVIMIPIFKVIVATNLYDNLWGLIIPAVASPTAVFLVRQYYVPIPNELMEAARIDGASELQIFLRVMLPLAKPVVSVLCIFSFMWRWNDYLWPKLVINGKEHYTLPACSGELLRRVFRRLEQPACNVCNFHDSGTDCICHSSEIHYRRNDRRRRKRLGGTR